MPHGGPDWGLMGPISNVYSLDDMAELAVRQGNPHSIDRLGSVLWLDDFKQGLGHWEKALNGTESAVSTTWHTAYTAGLSAIMWAYGDGVSGANLGHRWSWETQGKLGFEIWLAGGYYADTVSIDFAAGRAGGNATFEVRIIPHGTGLAWRHPTTGWHVLDATVLGWGSTWRFVPLKIVVDPSVPAWDHVVWAGQWYDLRGEPPGWDLAMNPWLNYVTIGVDAIEGEDVNLFLDNAIATQNEP